MASLKIVLRKNKSADGTYPLTIRITKDRKTSWIYLNTNLHLDQWDAVNQRVKKIHPNSARLNNFLRARLAEVNDKTLEQEIQKKDATSRSLRSSVVAAKTATFFKQADVYLINLKKAGKYNQYTADKSRVKHFKDFFQGGDVAFSDITSTVLERFKIYLKSSYKPKGNKKQIGERTIVNHLVVVRSVFSQAIKENIVDPKHYPFGKGKMKIKFPDSLKLGLSADEVKRIEDVKLEDDYDNHCRNLWLFSYYFAGMRVSDVLRLRFSDFQNERLHYSMGKNSKGGSLKIPQKAEKILKHYDQLKENNNDLIFPELKKLENLDNKFITQRTIAFAASRVDKCLRTHVAGKAVINKPLTMHIARHTFGNVSGDKIPIQMLQKLYRHSSITTTIGYQSNFIHRDVDDALDAVLNYTPS